MREKDHPVSMEQKLFDGLANREKVSQDSKTIAQVEALTLARDFPVPEDTAEMIKYAEQELQRLSGWKVGDLNEPDDRALFLKRVRHVHGIVASLPALTTPAKPAQDGKKLLNEADMDEARGAIESLDRSNDNLRRSLSLVRACIEEACRYSKIGHEYNFTPVMETIDKALSHAPQEKG